MMLVKASKGAAYRVDVYGPFPVYVIWGGFILVYCAARQYDIAAMFGADETVNAGANDMPLSDF